MSNFLLRTKALELLERVGDSGAFSHLMIDQTIKKESFAEHDRRLLTEIVYGTLQHKLTLEFFLNSFVKKKKLDKWVRWLLYMSFYQMYYLDKVPDYAIINEAVEISKNRSHSGIVKFVNGVLRSAQREGFPSFETIEDPIEQVAIETSHPYWLVERWADAYGFEKAKAICFSNLETKPMSIRINPMKSTRDDVINRLSQDGLNVVASTFSNQGIVIKEGSILSHPLFKEGFVTIQDQSSMLVSEMLDVNMDQTILDACSAPGGKATHIAEKLNNSGHVYAYDLHKKKANLVNEKAEQLGLINLRAKGMDARQLDTVHDRYTFDRILIDAPCSGFGVIRSKPDIKYTKSEDDVIQLAQIQFELLQNIAPLLKQDGKIVYSTCTIDPTENDVVIAEFLTSHQALEVDPTFFDELPDFLKEGEGVTPFGLQIFPDDHQTDGFFMTRLRYKEPSSHE
ncbi:16S rRNA (cytosine967-C5)-methyltransferase [Pelagirhabdus alkalitolerans]|uniref:16S rRNA (cytosine(967)-C(5))-methyltransferase n=1 Tax=Pelagirhabdus alkalitolerans TaxID=1612202 RepID=A0A1G6H1R2_9BACI|nr:16S rRNA (cytosine(967)-C(5))-methyltransferase RsmB [Pelagirhabdus alkalitolerans]SDB88078.1 16S rRNA (cytosine967-C5)-methyltransferase [Pelagirhabdus alkalitolerans]